MSDCFSRFWQEYPNLFILRSLHFLHCYNYDNFGQLGNLEEKVKTAVLWHKEQSQFKPDYSVEFLKGSPWIHMPFEKYETTNIKDFKI